MKIAVDVMGYENDISESIKACEKLIKKYDDLEIILVGDEPQIIKKMKNKNRIRIVHANSYVLQSDSVIAAMRKKDSSMSLAIDLVVNNEADAVVSAGSTPCYVGLTYSKMGLIKNITKKPGFMSFLPTANSNPLLWMDVGANKTCDADDLVAFALMGSIVCRLIYDIDEPKISLLNIGTEEYKGLDYIVKANEILRKDSRMNYQGYLESRDILLGNTNVLISDGFIGNIALKALEGTFKIVANELKKGFKKPSGWLGGLFSLPVLKKIKKTFDYRNNAGAIVVGLNHLAIKTHGSADEKQFFSTIELAIKCIKTKLLDEIRKNELYE